MFELDEIYPVSRFNALCGKVIKGNIPPVWVSGEVSNLSTPSSGHIYFSLKDESAHISCALFKFSARNLKFKLENGTEIMVFGGASLYENRGSFQIIVQKAQPVGVGGLELGFEQLKKQLHKEGLFDGKYKKPLPKFPKKIGVITSKTGAVLQDIIKVLKHRYPFVEIRVYDSQTQGESASHQLINALQFADKDNNDSLIIARGGGSREDLWCFNNEDLARTIFALKTPIISSIGHEVDSTIVDFVADSYAPTPSAAAMLVAPDRLEILQNLDYLTKNLTQNIHKNLLQKQNKLSDLSKRITKPNFLNFYQKIDELEFRSQNNIQNIIKLKKSKLESITHKLLARNPKNLLFEKINQNKNLFNRLLIMNNKLEKNKNKLNSLTDALIKNMDYKLLTNKNKFNNNVAALNHLSPLKVLDRGYSITSIDNKAIFSNKNVKSGDEIMTKLADGEIISVVK